MVEAEGAEVGYRTSLDGDGTGLATALEVSGRIVPVLVLADWLERYVDTLLRNGLRSGFPRCCQRCVDLMDGLSGAAEALRSSGRCDDERAEQQLRLAVSLLRSVDQGEIVAVHR
ncbi:hypothetical protein QRX60_29385 [Amycolatopsis mongoliensis]|uniref:Uncharacterized protein n=1 Tax=Amycolatopsis mongoliensis TaxID=715475 RepID=A0A9Y2JI76_9PSEU|nr:hypothetical protein [Amycolatopsis sp. 4-36]WIX98179.1 hypothetical protein QRX60_29385 [Amycolatopsis sp. 4-36]